MIAAIPSLNLIQRAIAGQEGGESNLTAEVFVEASEALSQLILSYATDPAAIVERAIVDNETLAVRTALKAQVADIGRALGITARAGAPAACVSTHALGVCAEKRVAADTGGPDAAPYSLANLQDPSAPPTIAKLVALASDIPGVDPAKPVEAVLFSSTMDLHGTGSQADRARAGAAVSFLLLQGGVELEVSGLAQPLQLTLPVRDGAELLRSCVGQPDKATLLERMLGGAPACSSTLECRYWDEEAHAWSTEGCRTVVYAEDEGGGLAGSGGQPSCECTHLSDFVAVKVPTKPTPNPGPNSDP